MKAERVALRIRLGERVHLKGRQHPCATHSGQQTSSDSVRQHNCGNMRWTRRTHFRVSIVHPRDRRTWLKMDKVLTMRQARLSVTRLSQCSLDSLYSFGGAEEGTANAAASCTTPEPDACSLRNCFCRRRPALVAMGHYYFARAAKLVVICERMVSGYHPILCLRRTHTSFSSSPPPETARISTSHSLSRYEPLSAWPEKRSKLHPCFGHVIPADNAMPKSSISKGVPLDSGYDECGHF